MDNKIRIVGFGTFEVRARSERKGINPATKEEIIIPASVTPVLRLAKFLRILLQRIMISLESNPAAL